MLAAPDRHSTRYSINSRSPLVAPLRQLFACAGSLMVTAFELVQKLRQGGALWISIAEGKKIDLKGTWTDVAHSKATAG